MRVGRSGVAVLTLLAAVLAREGSAAVQQGQGVTLVVPSLDSVYTSYPAHRVGGHVTPGSVLHINGEPVTVYPNGAFARLLPLEAGRNEFRFESVTRAGVTSERTLVIRRADPPLPVPRDTLRFADDILEPSTDLWLRAGDILELRCRATPGCTVTVGGRVLPEVPSGNGNGPNGIYSAAFRVMGNEGYNGEPLEFRLSDSTGRTVTRLSTGKVRVINGDVPLVAETVGDLPALNYGLGEDRLGGAKRGFIQAGVRLLVTGKAKNMYRAELAGGMETWVPGWNIRFLPAGTPPPVSLTGSMMVYGDSAGDVVTVMLAQRLPWTSVQEKAPTRIVVDVHGAVSNTNWITHNGTAREIRGVSVSQPAHRLFRVEIELAHLQIWGYSIGYEGNTLTIRVRRPPEEADLEGLTIAIDAGHGGSNEGAVGSTGAREKDINLATAKHLRRILLDRGASVFMTRTDDTASGIDERLSAILASGARILVSIHANSIGTATDPERIRGVSTYYRHACFSPLAAYILEELVDAGLTSFGVVGNFNFHLNAPTELPTVLVEQAFMSHPADEMLLLDDEFREEIAERIADGIERFLEAGVE